MRVKVTPGHRVSFVIDESVRVALECWIHTQGKDVLVVGGKNARVHNGTPRDLDSLVDWLGGKDTGGADFVRNLTGLVEHECQDVLVVCNSNDGLQDQLSVPHNTGTPGSVVGVLPANTAVLLMNANAVWHLDRLTLVVGHKT